MEELKIGELLDHFKSQGFERGEKVILGYFGTVQTFLSLIFDTPVRVQLVDQRSEKGVIVRKVHLMAGDILACRAVSHIPEDDRNRKDVIYDISAGSLGLGQIVVKYAIPNRRDIEEVGRQPTDLPIAGFWRTYTISGPSLFIRIHEHFLRQPFVDIGWLT